MLSLDKKKWLIFDLDNTIVKLGVDWSACREEVKAVLIKNYPDLNEVFNEKEVELKTNNKKLTVELMGLIAYKFFGHDVYQDFQDIQERYETSYGLVDMKVCAEIINFIREYDGEIKFAICSNNSLVGVEYALDLLSLRQKFSLIESRKVGRPPKPSSDILLDLLSVANAQVEECLFVGDNEFTDQSLAENVGMDYIDHKDFKNYERNQKPG